jgi:hypothetical protein
MCEVRSRKNGQEPKRKKKYSGQQQKEIDCDEPHPAPNEKTQPIRWTERPTGALVAVNSLWPTRGYWFTGTPRNFPLGYLFDLATQLT